MSNAKPIRVSRIAVALVLGVCAGGGIRRSEAANALTTVWSKQPAGSPFAAVDHQGSVLTAETTTGAIVATKYDSFGNMIWTYPLSDTEAVLAVGADASGNLLVASASLLTSLSPNGSVNFTMIPLQPILSMAVDANDNVLLAENSWNLNLTLEKFSAVGVLLVSRTYYSSGGIEDISLATDSAGNIIVAAAYQFGTIDFGGEPLTAPSLDSMILAKLTPTGDRVFSKIFNPTIASDGTYAGIYRTRVACDARNNIFTTGIIDGTGRLDMGSKHITLPSPGEETMFLAKFSPTGATSFARTIGTDGVFPEAIAIDTAGTPVVTGENWSSAFLGGVNGVFVAAFSSTGGFKAGRIIGSTAGTANSIAVDRTSNDVVAAGFDSPANYLLKLSY
jgi:hypothetical protein